MWCLAKGKIGWIHLGAIFLALLISGCGGSKSPSGPEDALSGDINTLTDVKIDDSEEKLVVEIQAQGPLSPNVFKLTDPLRVIIDFTDTQIGDLQSPIGVNNGVVNEVALTQFDDVSSSLSRVVIGFDQLVDYNVDTNDNVITIDIPKSGAVVAESSDDIEPVDAVGDDSALEELPLDEAPLEELPTADAAPGDELSIEAPDDLAAVIDDIPVEELAEPGRLADKLEDISYTVSGEETQISMRANGSVNNYDDFVLENPKRLVVDLKGLAYKGKRNFSLPDGSVDRIRAGIHPDKVRVVVDFSASSSPNYQIRPTSSGLDIVVAPVVGETDSFGEEPSSDLLADVTEPVEPTESLVDIAALPIDDIPVDESFQVAQLDEPAMDEPAIDEPIVDEPAIDVDPVAPEDEPFEPIVDEAPDAMPSVDPAMVSPYKVTSLDFVQMQGKSRLIIKADGPAAVSANDEGADTVVINLTKGSLAKTTKRSLDTSAFNSPVSQIVPKQVGGDTRIVATLREATPYTVTQEGNFVYVDFERNKDFGGVELAQAPTGEAEEAPAEVESPELSPEISEEEAAVAPEAAPEAPTEQVIEDESIFDEPDEQDDSKRYEYVKEELLSDSLSQEEGAGFGDDMIFEIGARTNRYTGRKINLDFKDADIRSLFRLFADISKLNIIVGDDVGGRVTIRLRDVPWDQAFAILLQTQNLGALKYGNIIRIAPAEKIQRERELHAQAKKAAIAAAPMDTLFKSVSYATATELTPHIQSILSERGTVNIDGRTNTLIIRDVREKLVEAKKLIEKLDAQTPQVSIEARIVEVSDTFVRNWGVQWGATADFSPATGNPTGLLFPNSVGAVGSQSIAPPTGGTNPILFNFPPTGANSSVTLNLGSINNVLDLDLLLGYEETEGNAKLISSPKVTVLDNRSATILSGTRIPFITQTENAGNNVRFENAVISITVTPSVTADGSVIMSVTATRNQPDFGQQVIGNPTIIQREATTEVLVKSGNTTVIGGIYQVNKSRSQAGLPFLRHIPILGYLFKADNRRLERQELLIFITPRIVGDEREVVRQVQG